MKKEKKRKRNENVVPWNLLLRAFIFTFHVTNSIFNILCSSFEFLTSTFYLQAVNFRLSSFDIHHDILLLLARSDHDDQSSMRMRSNLRNVSKHKTYKTPVSQARQSIANVNWGIGNSSQRSVISAKSIWTTRQETCSLPMLSQKFRRGPRRNVPLLRLVDAPQIHLGTLEKRRRSKDLQSKKKHAHWPTYAWLKFHPCHHFVLKLHELQLFKVFTSDRVHVKIAQCRGRQCWSYYQLTKQIRSRRNQRNCETELEESSGHER